MSSSSSSRSRRSSSASASSSSSSSEPPAKKIKQIEKTVDGFLTESYLISLIKHTHVGKQDKPFFFLAQARFSNRSGINVPFSRGFLNDQIIMYGAATHGEIKNQLLQYGVAKIDGLLRWNVVNKKDKEYQDMGGRIWIESEDAYYILISYDKTYQECMKGWFELADADFCLWKAAKEGVESLEEVDLEASYKPPFPHKLKVQPLTLDHISDLAGSILANADTSIESSLWEELEGILGNGAQKGAVRKLVYADVEPEYSFATVVEKIIWRRLSDPTFPEIGEDVELDDVDFVDREDHRKGLRLNEETVLKPNSFVIARKEPETKKPTADQIKSETAKQLWILYVINITEEASEFDSERDFLLHGYWVQTFPNFPLLGTSQPPNMLVLEESEIRKGSLNLLGVYSELQVTRLSAEQLCPEDEWFTCYMYSKKDVGEVFSDFSDAYFIHGAQQQDPELQYRTGDWVKFRYLGSAPQDPPMIVGRVVEVKEISVGDEKEVVIQPTFLKAVLLDRVSPAHLLKPRREARDDRQIVMLYKDSEPETLSVSVSNVYGFVSVFTQQSHKLMDKLLPETEEEDDWRVLVGRVEGDSARKGREGKGFLESYITPEISDSVLPQSFVSPQMKKEWQERQNSTSQKAKLKVHEGACGAGAFGLGFEQAGLESTLAVDLNEIATRNFKLNRPNCDVKTEDLRCWLQREHLDPLGTTGSPKEGAELPHLVAAGPPCNSFSTLNQYAAKGKHNDIFFTFLSIVACQMPDYLVIENVPTLVTARSDKKPHVYFQIILSILLELRYQVAFSNLFASEYGVPQDRGRLFFVATRSGLPMAHLPDATHKMPSGTKRQKHLNEDGAADAQYNNFVLFAGERNRPPWRPYNSVETAISDLPEQTGVDAKYASEKGLTSYQRQQRSGKEYVIKKDASNLNPVLLDHTSPPTPEAVEKMRKGPHTVEDFNTDGTHKFYAEAPSSTEKPFKRLKRINPNQPSQTFSRHLQPGDSRSAPCVHPYYNRLVSVAEIKRLFSYPDAFRFTEDTSVNQKIALLGQSVPPLVSKAIGKEILKARKKALKLNPNLEATEKAEQLERIKKMYEYVNSTPGSEGEDEEVEERERVFDGVIIGHVDETDGNEKEQNEMEENEADSTL